MKRSAGILLAAWLPGGAWALPASAAQPGHPAGWVLHTDIAAYIDGRAIPSYNIDGNTYTAAEDPAQFGFSVLQREGDGLFFILDRTGEATMQYVPVPSGKKSGSRACTCEDARALVILTGEPTKAVSVGGKISIPLDDLHCSCTSTPARTGGKRGRKRCWICGSPRRRERGTGTSGWTSIPTMCGWATPRRGTAG